MEKSFFEPSQKAPPVDEKSEKVLQILKTSPQLAEQMPAERETVRGGAFFAPSLARLAADGRERLLTQARGDGLKRFSPALSCLIKNSRSCGKLPQMRIEKRRLL